MTKSTRMSLVVFLSNRMDRMSSRRAITLPMPNNRCLTLPPMAIPIGADFLSDVGHGELGLPRSGLLRL